MVLHNGSLQVVFDDTTGALRSLVSEPDSIQLLESDLLVPFILEKAQDEYTGEFDSFSFSGGPDQASFAWKIPEGTVRAEVALKDHGLCFRSWVENSGAAVLHSLEYPLIDGLSCFGEGKHQLIHPFATGMEFDNPLEHFEEGGGLRYMPYPESFSGASMQFFAYYEHKGPGLYFAAYDGEGRQKWLNFYKHSGKLRASQIQGYEDTRKGKSIGNAEASWDFVLKPVRNSRWELFADIYREWAHKQRWCGKGKLSERDEHNSPKWLLETTGAITFGIDASFDRSKWIKKYREDIGERIFHILGPDWPKMDQNFYNSIPGGYDDWFPTRFNKAAIDCIREQGDNFAPFEFDFLVALNKSDAENIKQNLQVWPEKPKSVDKYTFTMLCPITSYTREFHVRRDRRLVSESGCSGIYYDISANNILHTCMSEAHGHAPGAGKEMSAAYNRIYRETREAASAEAGRYIPLGTEMINETLIDEIDYYQARANAQPNASLETWPFRSLIRQNKARLIPLFKYVYSEYAPLRCDGWGKLTAETGDIIYHTIAKTYLWGGLFEINLEYAEMENLGTESPPGDEHYYHFGPKGFAYDGGIARFIGKCARLRLGKYGKPLIYGRMLPTPEIRCRNIYRPYFMYNHGTHNPEYNGRGLVLLGAVLAQAYQHEGKTVLYGVNTSLFDEEGEILLPGSLLDQPLAGLKNPGEPEESLFSPEVTGGWTRVKMRALETVVIISG